MKKSVKTFLMVLAALVVFLFAQPVYVWLKGGSFEIPGAEVRYLVFIVVITPFLIWLSSKIKRTLLFIVLAIAFIAIGAFLMNLIFPF